MNKRTLLWLLPAILAIMGAAAGYAYYHYVGCVTGTCPITSKPLNSTLYGALLGFLIGMIFTPSKKKEN